MLTRRWPVTPDVSVIWSRCSALLPAWCAPPTERCAVLAQVPDYTSYVKHPMDFSTMRTKVTDHVYKSMSEFETDFSLIISNCLTYNSKDTVFYRSAIRLRDQVSRTAADDPLLSATVVKPFTSVSVLQ